MIIKENPQDKVTVMNLSEYFDLDSNNVYYLTNKQMTPFWLVEAIESLSDLNRIGWTWDVIHSICCNIDYSDCRKYKKLYEYKPILGNDPERLYIWAAEFCNTKTFKDQVTLDEICREDNRGTGYYSPLREVEFLMEVVYSHINKTICDAYLENIEATDERY